MPSAETNVEDRLTRPLRSVIYTDSTTEKYPKDEYMVTLAGNAPREAKRRIEDARSSLRGDTPKALEWIDRLTHAHQRQFAVELYSALARLNVSDDLSEVYELLEAWEATAEIDAAPDVAANLRKPKQYRAFAG